MALTLGIMSAILAVTFLETLSRLPEVGWRLALGLQVVPAAVLCLGVPFVPESPRWHMINGREGASKRALIRIRKSNSLEVLQELHEMKTYARHHGLVAAAADDDARHHALRRSAGRIGSVEAPSFAEEPAKSGWACVSRGADSSGGVGAPSRTEWRGVAVAVILLMFQQLSGINTILYYSPEILKEGLLKPTAAPYVARVAVLLTMSVNCIFSFIPVFLVDRVRPRAARPSHHMPSHSPPLHSVCSRLLSSHPTLSFIRESSHSPNLT